MLGPSLEAAGGIAAVATVYRNAGLFDRWQIIYLSTYQGESYRNKLFVLMAALVKYLHLLTSGKVGLLHAHSASRSSFLRKSLFILPALALRIPVIFHLHGGEFVNVYERELGPLHKAYIRFILKRCTTIVVLSERWKTMLGNIIQGVPVKVIMNPINSTIVSMDRRTRIKGRLLFLGRLEAQKGIYVLLDAVARLDRKLEWSLLIGGNGDLRNVQTRIDELGIGHKTSLLGWVEGARKAELLDTAMALILPSFAEGLPMSMLEAMAHSTPVVATPVGGIPDLLEDGKEGMLVPQGNADRLAAAITHLLKNPGVVPKMGSCGFNKFRMKFSSDVVIPQVEALYQELGIDPSSFDCHSHPNGLDQ